jgi:hypothetical protein
VGFRLPFLKERVASPQAMNRDDAGLLNLVANWMGKRYSEALRLYCLLFSYWLRTAL